MRLEKSYRMWGADLTREYSILEAGLSRFVRLKKDEFVGKEALVKQIETGVPQEFVTLEIEATDADAMGSEPIFFSGWNDDWTRYFWMLRTQCRKKPSSWLMSNAGNSDIGTEYGNRNSW